MPAQALDYSDRVHPITPLNTRPTRLPTAPSATPSASPRTVRRTVLWPTRLLAPLLSAWLALAGAGPAAAQAPRAAAGPSAGPGTPGATTAAASPAPSGLTAAAVTPFTPVTAAVSSLPAVDGALVLEAREAARRRDGARLAAARATLLAAGHPLAPWADYWELNARLKDASTDEVEAFYARWSGSYVEDRLRNDWLLELGRRRDFGALLRDFPRFRMNDDREVSCYALWAEHQAGKDVTEAARRAWWAQRDLDDGCHQLAGALVEAKRFGPDEVWRKARLALEQQRPGAAKAAAGLLTNLMGQPFSRDAAEAIDNPAAFLRKSAGITRGAHELRLLALMRLAQGDADAALAQLADNRPGFTRAQLTWAWAYLARQAAFKLQPEAAQHVQRGWQPLPDNARPDLSDETLGWGVRALLRSPPGALANGARWRLVQRHIEAMSATERADPAWVYWRAVAQLEQAKALGDGAAADALRAEGRSALEALAGPLGFYPNLALDLIDARALLPAAPAPLQPAEREAAARHPGLQRALMMTAIGLRDEARREWNFSLRGMDDRQLNAAARLACDVGDWQLCINTAERTRQEVDLALRYPMPYLAEIQAVAQQANVETGYVLAIIRQETRFMAQLRSSAGATGLMQVMPETGRIVARRIGLDLARPGALADPATNLRLGTAYLRMLLDDFGGSQAMTAAGYNAGPGRPRRWREGLSLDAAAWTETIPFNETRDYVKKVLGNAAAYGALLDGRRSPAIRPRLGERIGPRAADAPPVNNDLP